VGEYDAQTQVRARAQLPDGPKAPQGKAYSHVGTYAEHALLEGAKFTPYSFLPASNSIFQVRKEFREIFFSMGFEEMPTNNFVESSFWNFDALFQPQQHPARDAHDTFFMAGAFLPLFKAPRRERGSGVHGENCQAHETCG